MKTEKVSVKDIVQRELAEIDAFLFEEGEIVRYEIALESVPEKIRKYARENQVIYGFEEENDKLQFMTKEAFIKKFAEEYCENHRENVEEQTLQSEMFAYCSRKRKQRFLKPLTVSLAVVLAIAIGVGAAYIYNVADAKNGTKATISQLKQETKTLKKQLSDATAENGALYTQTQALETENGELKTKNEELTTENEALLEEAEQWRANKEKVGWYNANAVIVYQDGADLYHTYGCTRHQNVAFAIYDVSRAKSNGYLACPHCLGN